MSAGRDAAPWSGATLHVAVALSLVTAVIHLWVAPEHFGEWWGYGAFFVVTAAAQGALALGLVLWPSRPLLLSGAAGNLIVVILWLVTRTTGIPLLGPHAGEVEEVGSLDLVCTVAEVCVVVGLGALAVWGLSTDRRIQVAVSFAVSALLFWHLLHLLAGASAH